MLIVFIHFLKGSGGRFGRGVPCLLRARRQGLFDRGSDNCWAPRAGHFPSNWLLVRKLLLRLMFFVVSPIN